MSVTLWAVVGLAAVAGFFMAWTLGANSNSPPFAPAVGANAVPTMRAALLVGVFAALGALTQGGSISETVGAGLIQNVDIVPLAATAALMTAAGFMLVGVYSGYPIPAAFATTGAVVGTGLALGGDPAWDTYRRLGIFWLSVPFVSGGIAYTTAKLLRRDDVPDAVAVPLLAGVVGGVLVNIDFGFIPVPTPDGRGTVAGYVSRLLGSPTFAGVEAVAVVVTVLFAVLSFVYIRRKTLVSVDAGIKRFLLILGSVVAFSSGGSQVGLATGPLEHLARTELGLPSLALLSFGAVGLLAGAWTGAPRLLQATSREYARLGVRRSIAALVPGFLVAQVAIAWGIPVSFNNIILSGVIGGGLAAGSAGVSREKILRTVFFWLVTLVSSVGVAYALYTGFSVVLGGTPT
ncbi:MAG: inorganic phosphate transporter [Halobacteriales archaeon]|nr:inorganic phosphate transporter [Halobacteriales archaeon]